MTQTLPWPHPTVHYSYVILFFATLSKIFTGPGQSPCIGVVIPALLADSTLNQTNSSITFLYLIATTSSALTLPLLGAQIDKLGIRTTTAITTFLLSCACFFFSFSANTVTLLLSFYFLRLFGQGSLFTCAVTAINYWWVESRGKAMGVAGACVSAVMLGLVPIMLTHLIAVGGWRSTYQTLGLLLLFFLLPVTLFFWREKPEEYGTYPDGEFTKPETVREKPTTATAAPTIKEPTRTPAFMVYAFSDLIFAATGTAFFFHLKGVYADSNAPEAVTNAVYPILAVVGIIGRLLSGYLLDKLSARVVQSAALLAAALGFFLVPSMASTTAYMVPVLLGMSISTASNVRGCVHANMFGRENLGKIQTVASSVTVLGSALGPFPFGVVKDNAGNFDAAFIGSGFLCLVGVVAVLKWGHPPGEGAGGGEAEMVKYERVGAGDDGAGDDVEEAEEDVI